MEKDQAVFSWTGDGDGDDDDDDDDDDDHDDDDDDDDDHHDDDDDDDDGMKGPIRQSLLKHSWLLITSHSLVCMCEITC